jgi:hypothetical protein
MAQFFAGFEDSPHLAAWSFDPEKAPGFLSARLAPR